MLNEESLPKVKQDPNVSEQDRKQEHARNLEKMEDATGRVPLLLSLFLSEPGQGLKLLEANVDIYMWNSVYIAPLYCTYA